MCKRETVIRRGRTHLFAAAIAAVLVAPPAFAIDGSIDLHLYADATYSAMTHPTPTALNFFNSTNSFSGSNLDFFPTGHLGKLDVLAEILFTPDLTNTVGVDTERLQGRYTFSDAFRVVFGRIHTPMGYYNDTFHHGQLFQLATARPWLTAFEDSGGLLPAHLTGVAIEGEVPVGSAFDFHYDLGIGNTHGYTPAELPLLMDHLNAKAIVARLRFQPTFLRGLLFGGNFMFDEIPAAPDANTTPASQLTDGVPHWMLEYIAGAHLVYVHENIHLINEFNWIDHHDQVTSMNYITVGGFSEVGYSFGDFTPYGRFEAIHTLNGYVDPYYSLVPTNLAGMLVAAAMPGQTSITEARIGLNWATIDNLVLKAELRVSERKGLAGGGGLPTQDAVTIQAAWGF